jgi:hypothetical protein
VKNDLSWLSDDNKSEQAKLAIEKLDADLAAGRITKEVFQSKLDQLSKQFIGFKDAFSGLCDTWDDSSLMQFGVNIWTEGRKLYHEKHGEYPDLQAMQDGTAVTIQTVYDRAGVGKRAAAERMAVFAVTWAAHAFQKILTSHTYASALMCSDASRETLADVEVPWLAFMVVVPNGILAMTRENGDAVDYTRILVTLLPEGLLGDLPRDGEDGAARNGRVQITLYDPSPTATSGRVFTDIATSFDTLLEEAPPMQQLDKQIRDRLPREQRMMHLARRLVVGLVLAMQHQDNFKTRMVPARRGIKKRDGGEPAHRITIIGKPIKVDCRAPVREYIEGRRHAPPSVQTLVRGHFKRQVIGIARAGRKVIWIEPYWRGPEDAPILTKPKLVG